MGVVNVTPDSFSDGGDAFALSDALAQAERLVADGADILDIGGESTRPGAEPVGEDEEIRRVVPVIKALKSAGASAKISIDTRRAGVMRAACEAGADIINDVAALRGDGALEAAAISGRHVVLTHMQGTPDSMQDNPVYDDVLTDVIDFLSERIRSCEAAGVKLSRIAVDPGIGFGKTVEHNVRLLANLDAFEILGAPVLLGVSRKSYIAKLDRDTPPKDRTAGSVATALSALDRGVRMFRVHDVAEHRQAFAIHAALAQEVQKRP